MTSSNFTVAKSSLALRMIFLSYAVALVLKKITGFQDGIVDIAVLLLIFLTLTVKPRHFVQGVRSLIRENVFKAFLIFGLYFVCSAYFSYNTKNLIALEFISVLKWLIYFFCGYLFAFTYELKNPVFPLKNDMMCGVIFVLLYSMMFYNWSGISSNVGDLFGFYDNSFESIFSLRSVFALFAFIVFIYALNAVGISSVSKWFLLSSSFVFLFMSGNRKMLIAFFLVALLMKMHGRYQRVIRLIMYCAAAGVLIVMTQSLLFDQSIDEYSNVDQPRMRTYIISYEIAKDYFPFGSGPATFASKGSMENYSHIYSDYGLDGVYGFEEFGDIFFYNDTYWAQVIGQYGVVGLVLFAFIIFYLFRFVSGANLIITHERLIFIVLFLSAFTPALQRIELGLFLFFMIGLHAQNNKLRLKG